MPYLYRHFDKDGALLYVGMSTHAMRRLGQHEYGSSWFVSIATVKIERFETRAETIFAERQAIKNERPIHNIRRTSNPTLAEKKKYDSQILSEYKPALIDWVRKNGLCSFADFAEFSK